MADVANLEREAKMLRSYWEQHVVSEANGILFKVARGVGETNWHTHEDEDEAFYVLDGSLRIEMRHEHVVLKRGDFFIVKRGVEHRPVADEDVYLLVMGTSITSTTKGGKPAWSFDDTR